MEDVLIAIISGGSVVAIIEGVREYMSWKRKRKATKEDRAELKAEKAAEKAGKDNEHRLKRIEEQLAALTESQKFIMYDRIRYLGQAYIKEKEIDFDDRHILNEMHKSYHYGLNGNGDLDILMEEVNHLPLKKY